MRLHLLLLISLVLFTSLSQGAPGPSRKTDVVTLYNGDQVTGEVKSLFSGLLEVSTHSMGTVQIEWRDVARLESRYHHEVRLLEGKRYYGTIEKSSRAGELNVSDVYGEHEIAALEVVEIRPVSKSFKDRIDIYLAAGFSYTKASSLGQTSFNTDISYEDERTRNLLTARLMITDTDGDTTRSGKVDLSRSLWTNREDTYRIVLGSYETNDELSLDYRYSVGTGLGRNLIESPKSNWRGALALQLLTEKSLEGETQESVEAILNTHYSIYKFATPELHLKFALSIYPSLTESGRVRGDTDINFRWEIVKDLYLDITGFGTYDNKAAEESSFDYGITTGIGWDY